MKTRTAKAHNNCEDGNVFFYILLGILLFAALAFTISRGMQGQTTKTLTKREAELAATDILNYAQRVERAIDKVRRNNCSENEISLENPIISGYTNPSAPTDKSCHVFNRSGGGISFETPADNLLDKQHSSASHYGNWHISSRTCIEGVGTCGADCFSDGLDNEGLLVFLHYIPKEVCDVINKKMDVPTPTNDSAYTDSGCANFGVKFTGSFNNGVEIDTAGTNYFAGKPTGCYKADSGCTGIPAGYHFYHVLLAR